MRVRDVMSTPVFTLAVDKHLIIAKKIMEWARVRHVPVVDGDNDVVGLVTQRDLLAFTLSSSNGPGGEAGQNEGLWTIPMRDVMRKAVETIHPDESVQAAARVMREKKIGCLPVVDRDGLVGILSEHDLLGIVERLPAEESVP